ncbi:hypothetical protein MZM54_03910 [[Brevibacterium] frigoritolerans]|nr:hypothetical protein [Peribacillus frigoritolerans]
MNKDLEGLIEELEELRFMENKYRSFINQLETEQLLIKQILEKAATWKSGKGKDAFLNEMEDYFIQYAVKIQGMEQICLEINESKEKMTQLISKAVMATKSLY